MADNTIIIKDSSKSSPKKRAYWMLVAIVAIAAAGVYVAITAIDNLEKPNVPEPTKLAIEPLNEGTQKRLIIALDSIIQRMSKEMDKLYVRIILVDGNTHIGVLVPEESSSQHIHLMEYLTDDDDVFLTAKWKANGVSIPIKKIDIANISFIGADLRDTDTKPKDEEEYLRALELFDGPKRTR